MQNFKIIETEFKKIKDYLRQDKIKKIEIKNLIEELEIKRSSLNNQLKLNIDSKKSNSIYNEVLKVNEEIAKNKYLLEINDNNNLAKDLAQDKNFIDMLKNFNDKFSLEKISNWRKIQEFEEKAIKERQELELKHQKEREHLNNIQNRYYHLSLSRDNILHDFLKEFNEMNELNLCITQFNKNLDKTLKREELKKEEIKRREKEEEERRKNAFWNFY